MRPRRSAPSLEIQNAQGMDWVQTTSMVSGLVSPHLRSLWCKPFATVRDSPSHTLTITCFFPPTGQPCYVGREGPAPTADQSTYTRAVLAHGTTSSRRDSPVLPSLRHALRSPSMVMRPSAALHHHRRSNICLATYAALLLLALDEVMAMENAMLPGHANCRSARLETSLPACCGLTPTSCQAHLSRPVTVR